uniref:Uncharacterized protein n=1 Tax=Anguilla anguilla TaxID=7936 RepID=A0A0E9R1Z9_ANGAN
MNNKYTSQWNHFDSGQWKCSLVICK